MSKALVIKGASFATNKIETIEVIQPVPCTGVSISQSTLTFTELGATATLTATVTPVDTTEAVTWSSSDTDVATVADGLVTSVGIGSATITAYCGTYSASCTVASNVVIDANSDYKVVNGYQFASTDLSGGKDYLGIYASNTKRSYFSNTNETGGAYWAVSTGDDPSVFGYPIKIPTGATSINVASPSTFTRYRVVLFDSQVNHTYSGSNASAKVLAITETLSTSSGAFTYNIDTSLGADSFAFMLRTESASASGVSGDVTVTFS